MRFRFIPAEQADYSLSLLCRCMQVTRSVLCVAAASGVQPTRRESSTDSPGAGLVDASKQRYVPAYELHARCQGWLLHFMRVRLIKKYAEQIDGVDLQRKSVGDVLDLPSDAAGLLLAEQWALPERRARDRATRHYASATPHLPELATAAETAKRRQRG